MALKKLSETGIPANCLKNWQERCQEHNLIISITYKNTLRKSTLNAPRGILVSSYQSAYPQATTCGVDKRVKSSLFMAFYYLILVPGLTSPSKPASLSPSPPAARIIPSDSTPISLTGFRFVTTTTCLPIRSAGS